MELHCEILYVLPGGNFGTYLSAASLSKHFFRAVFLTLLPDFAMSLQTQHFNEPLYDRRSFHANLHPKNKALLFHL